MPRTRLAMIASLARGRAGVQAHRAAKGRPDLFRLSRQEGEFSAQLQSRSARRSLQEELAPDDRQPDAAVLLRIADHAHGLFALRDPLGVLQDALAPQDDAAVALAQVLLGPAGPGCRADPGQAVVAHAR